MPIISATLFPAYAGQRVTVSLETTGVDLAADITYPAGVIASTTIAADGTYSLDVPDLSLLTPANLKFREDGPAGRRYLNGTSTDARIEDLLVDPPGEPESAALAVHAAAADPHPGYLTTAEGDAAYQPLDAVLTATTASFLVADETKLDGVETGATADQTGAEIKTAYEAEADTNAFTDAAVTKLAGVEALADVTDEANVTDALDGATLTDVGTPAAGDLVLLQDASDTNVLKVAQFSEFGGGGGGALVEVKSADESVASSTTLQNDDHLVLALEASSTYVFTALLIVDNASSSIADLSIAFTVPAGSGLSWTAHAGNGDSTATTFFCEVVLASGTALKIETAVGDKMGVIVSGTVVTDVTAGNLQLQWAQFSSNAGATTMYARSHITAWKAA